MLEELNIMVEEEGQFDKSKVPKLQTIKCKKNLERSCGCEHNFSTLKWIYGDYQTKLSIYKVEAMCKICSYYISNLDKELKYYGKGLNINEIRNNIFDSSVTDNFFDESDFNNINDIENDENQNININSNLELGNLINLSLPEFNSNFRSDIINEQSESLRNINVGNMSYDPSALVEIL
ncbi:8092_t:CDS:2 [Entrophospora sp. SA101]|nr:8092_t:CDS:2 [Entrophospora sp. SA101]